MVISGDRPYLEPVHLNKHSIHPKPASGGSPLALLDLPGIAYHLKTFKTTFYFYLQLIIFVNDE